MTDVTADVIAIIEKRTSPAKRPLKLADRLDEIGLDSLAAVEMIFDIEEKFDIQVPYNSNAAALEFETVGEVVQAINKLVNGKS
jgi:acyl carrier protein